MPPPVLVRGQPVGGLSASSSVNRVRYPNPPGAAYTAVSQFSASYVPGYAADGVRADPGEWAQSGNTVGGWWRCSWTYPQVISTIVLVGRAADQMGVCHAEFSDGSRVDLGDMTGRGKVPLVVRFRARSTTFLLIVSDSGSSGNPGFAEVEAY